MTPFFDVIAIDLDGTLVDSVGDLHAAIIRMQDALVIHQSSASQVRSWVGNGIERLVHRGLTQSMTDDANPQLYEKALPLFEQYYDAVNGEQSVLYPGVLSGLDWLASTGAPLCVVTNKARKYALPLLESLEILERFEHCIAGDDVTVKKPDPSALFRAAQLCGCTSDNALLIGDSVSDIKAAKAAGFTCVAVSYGYNHGQSVYDLPEDLQPDAIIDSFEQLQEILPGLASG